MYFEDLHGTSTSQQYDIIYVSIPLKYRLQTFIYSNVDTTKTVLQLSQFYSQTVNVLQKCENEIKNLKLKIMDSKTQIWDTI